MKILIFSLLILTGCAPARSMLKKTSVDAGAQYTDHAYPYVGMTAPLGPVNISVGLWTSFYYEIGPYITIGKSWYLFDK
jgi:hypothetical protein